MAGEFTLGNVNLYKKTTSIFSEISSSNAYDISSSLPQQYQTITDAPHTILLNEFVLPQIQNSLSNGEITAVEYATYLSVFNERNSEFFLSTYSQLIPLYLIGGNQSVFFRNTVLTGSSAGLGEYTGLDVYKDAQYNEMLDLQQLKDSAISDFTSNPCFLMDSQPNAAIEPLKLGMVRVNFKLLCRTIALYCKLQNIFLTSLFDNNEFYKSNDYKDSTFTDFCFEIFMQKLSSVIPTYKDHIYSFLNEDIKQKASSGEEVVNPITNEVVVFDTPISDDNKTANVDKYIKVLFLNEFLFISDKANVFFSQSIKDNGYTASFAPTTNFGTKLLSAKEFLLENIKVTGIDPLVSPAGKGVSSNEINEIENNKGSSTRLYLELSAQSRFDGYDVTLKLKMHNGFSLPETELVKETIFYPTTNTSLADLQLIGFMSNKLTALKKSMLNNEQFLLISNYVFPLNKILNIASITHINLMLKTYEFTNVVLDGSIKSIANIHDIIMGNEDKLGCELPDMALPETDNSILGVNLEILKAIATAPLQIVKGLEETFDPNIAIASKIRTVAESLGAPKLPIIPYSLGLLPVLTLPPPVGIGPPLIPPWGYVYWGIDASEVALSYAKNGFQSSKINIKEAFTATSKNPTKPDC